MAVLKDFFNSLKDSIKQSVDSVDSAVGGIGERTAEKRAAEHANDISNASAFGQSASGSLQAGQAFGANAVSQLPINDVQTQFGGYQPQAAKNAQVGTVKPQDQAKAAIEAVANSMTPEEGDFTSRVDADYSDRRNEEPAGDYLTQALSDLPQAATDLFNSYEQAEQLRTQATATPEQTVEALNRLATEAEDSITPKASDFAKGAPDASLYDDRRNEDAAAEQQRLEDTGTNNTVENLRQARAEDKENQDAWAKVREDASSGDQSDTYVDDSTVLSIERDEGNGGYYTTYADGRMTYTDALGNVMEWGTNEDAAEMRKQKEEESTKIRAAQNGIDLDDPEQAAAYQEALQAVEDGSATDEQQDMVYNLDINNVDSVIDDGTNREVNIRSEFMTGKRLKQYILEYGMNWDGDIDDIDDRAIYSKTVETKTHGFPPYSSGNAIDDLATNVRQKGEALATGASGVMNIPSQLREALAVDNVDYTVHRDGQEDKTVNYADFQDAYYRDYLGDYNRWMADYDKVSEEVQPIADEYNDVASQLDEVNDELETLENEGVGEGDPEWYDAVSRGTELYQQLQDLSDDYYAAVESLPDSPTMTLSDGTVLTAEEADAVKNAIDGNGDTLEVGDGDTVSVDYDYGPFNIAMPSGQASELIDDEGGVHADHILPAFLDIAGSSAPYFTNPTSAVNAVSQGVLRASGVNPYSVNLLRGTIGDARGGYSGVNRMNRVDRDTSVIGSLAMPVTERALGLFGAIHPITRAVDRYEKAAGKTKASSIANWLGNTGEEAIEEVLSSPVEDTAMGGISSVSATSDPDHLDYFYNISHDMDTPIDERMQNFLESAPNDAAGGALLGGILGLGRLRGNLRTVKSAGGRYFEEPSAEQRARNRDRIDYMSKIAEQNGGYFGII